MFKVPVLSIIYMSVETEIEIEVRNLNIMTASFHISENKLN